MLRSLTVLLLLLVPFVLSRTLSTLILLEDELSKNGYSRFFKSLKRRGHKLEIKTANEKALQLLSFGQPNYDNVIILSQSLSDSITYKSLLDFIDNGNNVMIGFDANTPEAIRTFAQRCGIDIHSKKSVVRDHFSYERSRDTVNNEVILASDWTEIAPIIPLDMVPSAPVLFEGVGMSFRSNTHFAFTLLSGNPTTYSTEIADGPPDKNLLATGGKLSLVSAIQTRQNARVAFIGSTKLLSNEFFDAPIDGLMDGKAVRLDKSGNEAFMNAVSSWAFGERSVLRASNATHFKIGDTTVNPNRYRIKDDVEYRVLIEEYSLDCDCWKPFIGDDVQFELIRLDPFVRDYMTHNGNGLYTFRFKLPDVFGVYKMEVNYVRRGWSNVLATELVSVRPFRHDEYDRFIFTAFPYYFGSFSMIAGFVVFTIVFLFGRHSNQKIW